MFPTEIIALKRDKKELTKDQIDFMIQKYAKSELPDYQMSALLMSILLNGMSSEETLSLTTSMMNSGVSLNWAHLNKPTVDKHSTGGVGDKTSLILGPIVACFDVGVPMIAGRGLGHSGGTIDKLEAIPGFKTEISLDEFKKLVQKNNISIIAQTKDICPADKKIYALRDVTSTVESIPLICASIMSKKLAEGAGSLVLDVKYGNGAFMTTSQNALSLAKKLKGIGVGAKRKVSAYITNMNQPLGQFAGNSIEIDECVQILKNEDNGQYDDCRELSLILSAEMLVLTKIAKTFKEGYKKSVEVLENGKAFEKFEQMISAQGGTLSRMPKPTKFKEIKSLKDGYLSKYDTRGLGYAGISLEAGRIKAGDKINPVAGIQIHKKIGDKISKGDVLFTLTSDSDSKFQETELRLKKCYALSSKKVKSEKLIFKKI